ncbi:MAG: winged helix-turn-helix domain-containing protein [Armatimonadota bacterium]
MPVARLQEQPARILEALTARAGQLVTRAELQKLLWPEDSLVDADNGLNIAINKIRLALDDSVSQPRYLQTVPRRGYRFIGEIQPVPVASGPGKHAEPAPDTVHPQRPGDGGVPGWPSHRLYAAGLTVTGLLTLSLLVVAAWMAPSQSATIRSAAVLPFANLAGDPELNYAAEGLSDTIATELAARGLSRMISTQATAHFRHANPSPRQIANALGAEAIVLGSVVRDGASFVVNVRLVDGPTERLLWAKRFVRATRTELTFSDDIVAGLAAALSLEPRATRPATARAEVPAARDEYLRGRYFWNLRTAQGMTSSVHHFTRAIELDRGYALAWAGLADVYAAGGDTPSALFSPWLGPLEAGLRSAEEALRIDPSLGEARAALGRFRMAQWRWSDAERELSEAVRLSPNYATARQWYGTLLSRLQKCPAAVEQAAVGGTIDPITPIINEAVGTTLAACGEPARAILAYRKVLEMHPQFASTRMRLAGAHLRRGDPASALLEYREAARLRPNSCEIQARMTGALGAVGNLDEARAIGARVLTEVAAGRGSRYCAALVYANLGDADGAFAALDAEVTAHGQVDGLLADFHLRPLHSDSRWPRLLERIGLTVYARSAAAR